MSNLWKELHERAISFSEKDDQSYLNTFVNRIPKYHQCKCQEFWTAWIKAHPPTYGVNENGINKYFEWTVETHNAVNKKLNKAILPLEEALKLYKIKFLEKS
jgi:hypothetical protein